MPSTFIENVLRGIEASMLTDIFLALLVGLFFLAFFWKRKHQHTNFTAYTPTLLTSIGILGTFAGIVVGLLDFDTSDIDNSIGPLLEGLKTAFISSLAGMFLSILYKSVVTTGFMIPEKAEIISDDDVTSLDLYQVLKQQAESSEKIRSAIAGDEDSSLVSLMKLQRADTNDQYKRLDTHLKLIAETFNELLTVSKTQQVEFQQFQDRLWRSLQEFADMMSKSATEQVIEALNQVIQDFNDKLTEQFGENFKQLNEAVFKLVEWQDNYKGQLEEMGQKYALGVEAITATEVSVSHISEDAKVIPETMNELKAVVEVNQHQISELDRHLEAFKDVRDKAVEAVPEIRERIDQAIDGAKQANDELAKGIQESTEKIQGVFADTAEQYRDSVDKTRGALEESAQATASSSEKIKEDFSDVITDINNNMRNLIIELQEGGNNLTKSYQEASESMIADTNNVQQAFSTSIAEMQRSLASTIEEQATEHRRQADRIFNGLESSIENALSNTGESVQKQIEMIDATMGQEVQKVMQSMGDALGSISGQFTRDYKQLVSSMQAIVREG